MRYTDDRFHMQVEFNADGTDVPDDQMVRMQQALEPLGERVAEFPESQLWLKLIFHSRSLTHHVQAKLKVPGRTIITGAYDAFLDTAFQHCVQRLIRRVDAYAENPDEEALSAAEARAQAEERVIAPGDADTGPLAEAVRNGDYKAFRLGLSNYEEWLRRRAGRWIQRYDEAQARLGHDLRIGDLVEEVYLTAFETFPDRPTHLRFHEWLDSLLDPALRELLENPDESEAASFARTVREMPAH